MSKKTIKGADNYPTLSARHFPDNMTTPTDNSELRQKLIDHIHRPIGWAKTGKQGDTYAMDVENTDSLAEDMADYALQILQPILAAQDAASSIKGAEQLAALLHEGAKQTGSVNIDEGLAVYKDTLTTKQEKTP